MGSNIKNIVGNKYGRLTVIKDSGLRQGGKVLWECLCDCQLELPIEKRKFTYATKSNLDRGINPTKKGGTRSCGCLHDEQSSINGKNNKKENSYDLTSAKYGIGKTYNGYEFYFDLEDYSIIRKYCWHKHQDGYLRTCIETKVDENGKRKNIYILMHNLIAKERNMNGEEVDHINGKTYDNRKENLRAISHVDNSKNLKIYNSNKSGHKGVHLDKREQKWKSYITFEKKRIHLGTFNTYEDAVKIREDAEEKYFKEYNRDKQFL